MFSKSSWFLRCVGTVLLVIFMIGVAFIAMAEVNTTFVMWGPSHEVNRLILWCLLFKVSCIFLLFGLGSLIRRMWAEKPVPIPS